MVGYCTGVECIDVGIEIDPMTPPRGRHVHQPCAVPIRRTCSSSVPVYLVSPHPPPHPLLFPLCYPPLITLPHCSKVGSSPAATVC